MRFISVRDLRGRSGEVWGELDRERELVITSNGKPIAILTATDERHFEESLRDLRQARAMRAVKEIQEESIAAGRDKMSEEDIEAEIAAVRKGRGR